MFQWKRRNRTPNSSSYQLRCDCTRKYWLICLHMWHLKPNTNWYKYHNTAPFYTVSGLCIIMCVEAIDPTGAGATPPPTMKILEGWARSRFCPLIMFSWINYYCWQFIGWWTLSVYVSPYSLQTRCHMHCVKCQSSQSPRCCDECANNVRLPSVQRRLD